MSTEPIIDSELAGVADHERDSTATKLIRVAEGWELFNDAIREGYATVTVKGHHETMRINSKSFRHHMSHQFLRAENKAPSQQALTSAINTIEAKAIYDGSRMDVHVRVAEDDGTIWVDLCNEQWEAVNITKFGWGLIQSPPVKFIRQAGMLPLPRPTKDGSMRDVEKFTTLRGHELVLLKGYMLGCLREHGPFPILALIGEQGSGKTTLSRLLKRTIDPSKAATRCLPKDERDLMIAAEGQHVLALDNLSHIDEQMSDALCRLATGGGLSTRTLYSDRDETVFECERPIILNAITDVLSRPDLIDRSIIVNVPPFEESSRMPERDFWRDFNKVHPAILGALCDAVSMALKEVKSLSVPPVRMADFCSFVSRGEKALGLRSKAFVTAYESNRRNANEVAVEYSPVAQALLRFLQDKAEWEGPAGELLDLLNPKDDKGRRRYSGKEFPGSPRKLSGDLRRVIPNLRLSGVSIKMPSDETREPGTGRRLIEIKCRAKPSLSSQSSHRELSVTAEPIRNETDTPSCDGRDGCDSSTDHATVESVPETLRIPFAEDTEVL